MNVKQELKTNFSLLFNPNSIAVVGASNDPKKFGNQITKNIIDTVTTSGKGMSLILLNPKQQEIYGVKCYPSLKEYGKPVDVAIIAVPKQAVKLAVAEIIEIGAKFIVIVTAGFGEIDEQGKIEEQELVKMVRSANGRMIGPNCVGYINMDLPLNASFIVTPKNSHSAFVSQSGSMGATLMYQGLGVKYFINLGNAVDVTIQELLTYFEQDSKINIVGVYLESTKNGRILYETVKNLRKVKPVVLLKGGRTSAGLQGASSHTGSMSSSWNAFLASAKQAKVSIALNEEEFRILMSVAELYIDFPKNGKIGIITNAGGPGVVLSDRCEERGLSLATISPNTAEKIKKTQIPLVKPAIPLDIIASARGLEYYHATQALLEESTIDILIVICIVPTFLEMTLTEHLEGVIKATSEYRSKTRSNKPVLATWVSPSSLPENILSEAKKHKIIVCNTIEQTVTAATFGNPRKIKQ